MKKLFVVLGLLLTVTMLFVGCGKTENNTNTASTTTPQSLDKTGTLQGKIMDAVTGAALGNDTNSELKVWLIQGTDNRGPNKLITDKNDLLCGEYAFSGIPVDVTTNEANFKVVVIKTGYQRFEANVSLIDTQTSSTFSNVINKIGNIYLFPLSTTAGDVGVYVYYPLGTPVANATVLLRQNVNNNNVITYTGDTLSPVGGLYTSLTTTTNAAGLATFSGANLTLGGNYSVVVEPVNVGGVQLIAPAPVAFIVGTNSTTRVVTLTATNGALYATSASNSVPGTATSSGVLIIAFNQPVVLTTTWFGATLHTIASNGSLTAGTPNATGALSPDGLTLTITPVFATAPTSTAYGAYIDYTYFSPDQIIVKSTQTSGGSGLVNINNITTGAALSGVVVLYNIP